MKCIDCKRIEPPPRGMPGYCKCPGDPTGMFKSLRYERQCEKFIQMDDAQRAAKREAWDRVWNPPKRAKKEDGDEQD